MVGEPGIEKVRRRSFANALKLLSSIPGFASKGEQPQMMLIEFILFAHTRKPSARGGFQVFRGCGAPAVFRYGNLISKICFERGTRS